MSLTAEGIAFSYKSNVVLHDVSVGVEPGCVLGLLGPNGSGKSTFLKIVARILQQDRGRVVWDGRTDLATLGRRALAQLVAYVPQGNPTAFQLSVVDAVLLGRTPYFGITPGKEDWRHVWDAIDLLGLTPFAQRSVSELSGGQAQRVLIARAIAQQPRLLLLDEPTSALDLKYQVDTLSLIRSVARNSGVAAIIAIHDLNHAARYCDTVAFLNGGRIVAKGSPRETYLSETIQSVYGLPVEVDDSRRHVEVRPLDAELDGMALVGVRRQAAATPLQSAAA